jgi:retron-type reverse transcriptase
MILYIWTDIQANEELILCRSWFMLTLFTDTLGWYPNYKSGHETTISGIEFLKNEHLTEIYRDEVNKSCIISCEPTQGTLMVGTVKQSNKARNHSLNLTHSYNMSEIWITLSLRGNVIRNYKKNIIQSLDSTKSQNSVWVLRRNTTLITNQLGSLNRRRYYSTQFDVINRLEYSKRELEAFLTPKLKQNLLDYKRDNKTIWILDNQNVDSSNIKLGIKTYISICRFLIAIKTSITFTRYLNLKFDPTELINYELEDALENLPNTTDLYKTHKEIEELKGHYIKSKDPVEYNRRNRFSNVYREKLIDPNNWEDILEDSKNNLENIIFKFWAVELTQLTNGAKTASVDGIAFKSKGKLFEKGENREAKEYLANKYKNLRRILSIAKGNTDQSIKRKGLAGLNKREKLRKHLKSHTGREYLTEIRLKLRFMKASPVEYANSVYHIAHEHNNNLKFDLCKYIRNSKLKNYKPKNILRVYIPKANGKLRPLGIPSIYDRCLQNLLKLVMEPYMEPLGDEFSFGFRPGRNCHQITSYVHHRLMHYKSSKSLTPKDKGYLDKIMTQKYMKMKNIKGKVDLSKIDPVDNIKITIPGFGDNIVKRRQILAPSWLYALAIKKPEKIMYDTQYILDADIKSCFDNISHEWLIRNVPMPKSYEHLLPKILKITILEEDKSNNLFGEYTSNRSKCFKVVQDKSDNIKGVPQGGIISPLLMNWTLDGLQHHIKISAHNLGVEHGLYSMDRANYLKRKDIEDKGFEERDAFYRNKSRIEWYSTTWFTRYADDFLVGVKSEYLANLLKDKINEFLLERGLKLSEEKTKIIPWKIGNHVDFLGWTHSLIKPNKVNWMISTSKQKAGKLIDWIGTYTYPSQESTKRFREQIKILTSNINNYLPIDQTFKMINSLIRGWSNYFSPAPHQIHLRRHLDTYVWKRLRKLFMNKFAHSFHDMFIQHFTREVDRRNKKAFYHKKSNTYRIWLQSPSILNTNVDKGKMRSSSLNVLNLTKLNVPSMWLFLVPTQDLFLNSMLINNSAYIKRALLMANYRRDIHSTLSFKQEHKCTLCNKSLINLNALLELKSSDIDCSFNDLNNDVNTLIYDNESPTIYDSRNLENIDKRIIDLKWINIARNKNAYWLPEVEIDHIFPKALAGNSLELNKILDRNMNLQLVHKSCHNKKQLVDKFIIEEYRKIKKTLLSNNLDFYSEEELKNASYKIILEMHKHELFKEYNKQIVAQLIKVSKGKLPKTKSKSKSKIVA